MSNEKERTEINTLGEFGLIDHLTSPIKPINESTLLGVGDDAGVIKNDDFVTLISTDMLVEGIHFDLMYCPLKHLGYKAVTTNISDIYAMNGTPKQITFSMALSNRFSVEAMEELYAGIHAACERYGVDLIGGDTTSSTSGLVISVTAIGQGEKEKLVYRTGAKVGDLICFTGDFGAAYLGLQLLEREKQIYLSNPDIQPNLEGQDYAVGRQLKPEARKEAIEAFAKNGLVPTSMIDVSDGISSELHHICRASGVGAFLEESGVPIHPDVEMLAVQFNLDPITCALSGGEDYELLFTINPQDIEKVKFLPGIYVAGEIVDASDGIKIHTKGGNIHELPAQGFTHFKK